MCNMCTVFWYLKELNAVVAFYKHTGINWWNFTKARSSVSEKHTLYVAWLSYALQVNPPYYVKLVELVPHPETAAMVMDTTHALMTKVKILD